MAKPVVTPPKVGKGPPKAIADAMLRDKTTSSPQRLEELKGLVKKARVLQVRIANGNELLGTLTKEQNELLMEQIPDMMESVGVKSIVVEREGNEPPFSATNKAFYSAGLTKKLPDEVREEGFDYLTEIGHGDLIKQEVTFLFPINTPQELIFKFINTAIALKIEDTVTKNIGTKKKPKKVTEKRKLEIPYPSTSRDVHHARLTSWLKRQVESGFVPKLDKIGGFVGRKVEIKSTEG